jgi:enoyl-CoA hydratase/carnithine racemase
VLQTAPEARAHVKRMLNDQYGRIDYETMFASLAHGQEVREGMRSFMEKRAPNWIPADLPEV